MSNTLNKPKLDEIFSKAKSDIRRQESLSVVDDSNPEILKFCLTKVFENSSDRDEGIAKYHFLNHALLLSPSDSKITRGELQKLIQFGTTLLGRYGFRPTSSHHGWLYAQLYFNYAKVLFTLGDFEDSLWSLSKADYFAPSDFEFLHEMGELRGDLCFSVGKIKQAQEIYESISTDSPEFSLNLKFKKLRCYRLTGVTGLFKNLSKDISLLPLSPQNKIKLEFENHLLANIKKNDFPSIVYKMNRSRSFSNWPVALTATLMIYASDQKKLLEKVPKINTLRKKSYDNHTTHSEKLALKFLYHLEECYSNDIPILEKLEIIEKAKSIPPLFGDPELELLAYASLVRWSARFRQKQIGTIFNDWYINLSKQVSHGHSADVLNILANVDSSFSVESYWIDRLIDDSKNEVSMPASNTKRSLLVAKLIGKILVKKVSLKMGIGAADYSLSPYEDLFKELVNTFTMLKGPVLKIGQQLYTHPKVNEESRSILEGIFTETPPIPAKDIVSILEKDLGKPVNEVFSEFNRKPLAVASIGQVHKAILKNGDEVVVKVLFPRIKDIVKNDLNTFRVMVLPLLKRYYKEVDVKGISDDIRDMMYAECDYISEVNNLIEFGQYFENNPRIIIPTPYRDLCSENIIVMSYHEGQSLVDFAKVSNEAEKLDFYNLVTEMYGKCYFEHGAFQGDVHPHNFLIDGDQLVCLDFGFIVRAAPEKVTLWANIFSDIRNDDSESAQRHLFEFFGKEEELIKEFTQRIREIMMPMFQGIHDNEPAITSFEDAKQQYEGILKLNMDPKFHRIFDIFSSEDLCGLRLILAASWLQSATGIKLRRRDNLDAIISFYKPKQVSEESA